MAPGMLKPQSAITRMARSEKPTNAGSQDSNFPAAALIGEPRGCYRADERETRAAEAAEDLPES